MNYGFSADPEPAFYLNADPNPAPDPGRHTNADPDPGQTFKSQKIEFLLESGFWSGFESESETNFRPDPDPRPDPKLLFRIRNTDPESDPICNISLLNSVMEKLYDFG